MILYLLFAMLTACGHPDKRIVARLDHTLSGCFASEMNQLTVYEEQGVTFAKLVKNGNYTRETKLTPEQLKDFQNVTNELRNLKERDGCTTVEDYILRIDGKTVKKSDGGCSWHGFHRVERKIFGDGE